MPVPERYVELFGRYLSRTETLRGAANADLWLRYRRLALTDQRLLCLERGGLRHLPKYYRLTTIPLRRITAVDVQAGRVQTTLTVMIEGGGRFSYGLPSFSKGTDRFCAALRAAVGGE